MKKKEQVQSNSWWYNGKTEIEIPEYAVGFVYVIVHKVENEEGHLTIKEYVGKKLINTTRRKKIGVREKTATKTRKTYKVEVKGSGWEQYWGSSKSLLLAREIGEGKWYREILEWCYSKKNMTYTELKWQFKLEVLEKDSYNDNINGSLYRHDTNRQLYEEFLQRKRDAPKKPRQPKQIPY